METGSQEGVRDILAEYVTDNLDKLPCISDTMSSLGGRADIHNFVITLCALKALQRRAIIRSACQEER